jgi:GTP cyclohydrolase II
MNDFSDPGVQLAASAMIPTAEGDLLLCAYTNAIDSKEHLAVVCGAVDGETDVLVRMHSECFTGDVLGSRRCDCGPQLAEALHRIQQAGRGVVLYLRQEGRGIGLIEKLKAYNLQDQGHDTVEANLLLGHSADARDYSVAAAMLRDLGVRSIRLMTNNPGKLEALVALGINVTERVPLEIPANADNARYLETKARRMRHLLNGGTFPNASHAQ